LRPNLPDAVQVDRELVVDAMEPEPLQDSHHFAQRPHVTQRLPATAANDRVVTSSLRDAVVRVMVGAIRTSCRL
jgi:hypothetical protein